MINWKNWLTSSRPKGVKLTDYKSLSNHDGKIKSLPLYNKYYISLLQRDGEKAIPTVKIGDHVNQGDIIGRPTSNLALHRHAPTSGEVTAIVEIIESHPSAVITQAIEITADGKETATQQFPPIKNYQQTEKQLLLKRIFEAGIAGMGGAGFPTEKKLNLKYPVETLIINGAECEPYITCDDLLMRHQATEILSGAQIFATILGAKQILVGIEDNKPEAIAQMNRAAQALKQPIPITVVTMPTRYPMGSRYQIAHYLLGKKPDIRKRSYESGFVCHNVATAKAAYDAIVLGRPLTERLVTFSGDAIKKPGVYLTKVGTNIADISQTIALDHQCQTVIFGGTMMGFSLPAQAPKPIAIKRETTSVLGFDTPWQKTPTKEQACIRCGHCALACPMDLLPQQLQFYGKRAAYEQAEKHRLFDCIECGLCTYVCPSDIPLVQIFQHSKGQVLTEREKKRASEQARLRFEARNQRLEKEKAERAQRSAARRAKLKKAASNPSSNDKAPDKQDLIAAALARTQARKKQQSAPQPPPAEKHNEPS